MILTFCTSSIEDTSAGDASIKDQTLEKQEEPPSTQSYFGVLTAEGTNEMINPDMAVGPVCVYTQPEDNLECLPIVKKYHTSSIQHRDLAGSDITPKDNPPGNIKQKISGEAIQIRHVMPQQENQGSFYLSRGFFKNISAYKTLHEGSIIYTCEVKK